VSRMTKRALILAVLLIALAGAVLMQGRPERTGSLRDIVIATSTQPLSAPVYVAQEKGFFRKEGLRVTLKPQTAGIDAMNETIKGQAHFGTVADTPLMFAGLKGERVFIIASIGDTSNYVRIVARKDRGITRPEDLRGKTVGVRPKTSGEYFLSSYLTFNGVPERDIHMVPTGLPDMADALVKGEIDAAVSWDPYAAEQQKALGDNASLLMNRYVYKLDWNIVGNPDFLKRDPEAVERLLRALIQATDYILENPGDARVITARFIGRSDISIGESGFSVNLDQSLIVNLESQARWAIRHGLADRKEVPNYMDMLYTKGLDKVYPKAVTVIRE
jgi:NitT/TauT family transport system substrate-binding protein